MDLPNDKYVIIENNEKYQIIGKGGFSEVLLGKCINTSQYVAIKQIPLMLNAIDKSKIFEKLALEIELMQKISHPNIVTFIDVYKLKMNWYIIMEYCNAGTLDNVIIYNEKNQKSKSFVNFNREANSYYYMNQLKDALYYLKKIGYSHRDIKPMNILLTHPSNNCVLDITEQNFYYTEKLILKLADFGLAISYETDDILKKTLCGSPQFMGPEIVLNGAYNSKADLWSYGTIMYQLLFGFHPFQSSTLKELENNLKYKHINFVANKNISPECNNLLENLLEKDPIKRIEWDSFFIHKWFQKWEKIMVDNITNDISSMLIQNKKSIMVIPKSKPIDIIDNKPIVDDSIQYNSPLGFNNLSRMKLDINFLHLSKNFTFSNQATKYSPPNYQLQRSISMPIKKNESFNTSRSRIFKNYKQDIEKSSNLILSNSNQHIQNESSKSVLDNSNSNKY